MESRILYLGATVAALCAAPQLLNDPSPAVRNEARMLVLDHPDGAHLVDAELGEPED